MSIIDIFIIEDTNLFQIKLISRIFCVNCVHRSYAAIYQRRKRFQQEESQILNQTFDSHTSGYRPASYTKVLGTNREYSVS